MGRRHCAAALTVLGLLGAACTGASGTPGRSGHRQHHHRPDTSAAAQLPRVPAPQGPTTAPPVRCPGASTTVHDAAELTTALKQAGPGTVIALAAGVYAGRFVATAQGTAQRPIYLCGAADAVLDGGERHRRFTCCT